MPAHRSGMRRRNFLLIPALVLAMGFTACQPPEQPPRSAWGEIITIAQAEQSSAPALWAEPSRIVAAWIGADDGGLHHDVRQWANGRLFPVTVLPLPPTHPYAQSWAAGQDGALYLFWLDANEDGQTALFSALISPQFTVERGPTLISDQLALRYAAAVDTSGRVWAVWSGGLLSEPVLSLRSIDTDGRPQPVQQVATDADFPALARLNDGSLLLFWLEGGQLMRAVLNNGIVGEAVPLTRAVYLDAGDRLHSLTAGVDQTHAYVFWNITRSAGQNETWYAAGEIDAPSWAQSVRLRFDKGADSLVETGFNTGSASAASPGETPLAWTAPLSGQYAVLPAAVGSPSGLGVIYFSGGGIVGYQDVVPEVSLIGLPALAADRNRHLYLAWAQPSTQSPAALLLTSTAPRGS